ncbi:MAG TPA: HAD-IA family hydrolase [Streptosporangiaceae bacterium]|nr:HAD-IA family hydrolase [Streptosporangiaceae bacterium]
MVPAGLPIDRIDAVIFDTDGVITDTARVHATAWKTIFDSFLRAHSAAFGEKFRPFDVRADYLRYVDGKPRLDGIRSFLIARGIELPPDDAPEVIRAIGLRKDALFRDEIKHYGVAAYPSTVRLICELRQHHVRTAAVSASRNCGEVLRRAGVADMFDVRVDGLDAARLGFPGKPHPGLFLEAARRLEVAPERAAVVEDALAGVIAARSGGFGLVIGVDRADHAAALRESGADLVVADLGELALTGTHRGPATRTAATTGRT